MTLRSAWTVLLAATLLLAAGGPASAADTAQMTEDWESSADLFKTYFSDLNSSYSFKGQEAEYMANWRTWKKQLQEFLPEFKEAYGQTTQEVVAAFEGVEIPQGVGNHIRQIVQELYNLDIAAKEKEIAGWAADSGDEVYATWERYDPPNATKAELKLDYAQRALAHYQRAAEIDPTGGHGANVEKAKTAVVESKMAWKKAVGELEWPGHNEDFAGPGDPDDLVAEALKCLKRVKNWSKPEYDDEHIPITACVTASGWEVSKRAPITKEPTQFSLNFLVAFAGAQDPEIAYVYNMVFYTAEEGGVAKEPPFKFVNSRQYAKYRMLVEDIPKQARKEAKKAAKQAQKQAMAVGTEKDSGDADGGKAADTEAPEDVTGCWAACGWILRLVLAGLLILGGLALAKEQLAGWNPSLGGVGSSVAAAGKPLGLALLVVGLLAFLWSLVHLAPLADILPQLTALAAGLALAGGSLPFGLSAKLGGLAQAMEARAKALGLASLALGILHLILAGVWLV